MSGESRITIGRWISIVAHPLGLALVLVGVSAAKLQGGRAAAQLLGLTAVVVVVRALGVHVAEVALGSVGDG